MTWLSCGCCGNAFDGDQDDQHDAGYGTCTDCEIWIGERHDAELDALAERIGAALSPENRERFDALGTEERRTLVVAAIEDGVVTWEVRRER